MQQSSSAFDQALDAVEVLSPEEQEDLLLIVRRRLAEAGRQRLLANIEEARREYAEGKARVMSVDEIMREITS